MKLEGHFDLHWSIFNQKYLLKKYLNDMSPKGPKFKEEECRKSPGQFQPHCQECDW